MFMTVFMLLEGPAWVERFYTLLPERSRDRWRGVGDQIYRTVGGYVTGNLLISLIAGVTSTIVLLALGVPYARRARAARRDPRPRFRWPARRSPRSSSARSASSTSLAAGIILIVFFILYQQLENHLLQPLVYSRTVRLSPLVILDLGAVGAELAGVLGALAAIPVAGTIQVLLFAWLEDGASAAPLRRRSEIPPVRADAGAADAPMPVACARSLRSAHSSSCCSRPRRTRWDCPEPAPSQWRQVEPMQVSATAEASLFRSTSSFRLLARRPAGADGSARSSSTSSPGSTRSERRVACARSASRAD